jgi:hypothetical protein
MMSDLRTILERGVGGATPPPDGFERMLRRRDRKRRNQRIAAGVVGIAVFVTAIWVVTTAGSFDRTTTPADKPRVNPNAAAEEVALGFLDAYAAFDAQKAMTYVADDADLSSLMDVTQQFPSNTEGVSLRLSRLQAVSDETTVTSCEAAPFGSDTSVVCGFVFHALGSDQIGRGPFSGSSFVFTIRDGAIVRAGAARNLHKFNRQMWKPFAEWVSSTYPKDAAVMYVDGTLEARFSLESIRLWEQHTRDYVKAVQQGTA